MSEQKQDPKNAAKGSSGGGGLGSLFGTKEKKKIDPEVVALRHDFNSLSRRLRELEERSQNLRKKVQMTDQNFMNQNKRSMQELKTVHSEMRELKHFMNDLDNKMLLLIKELRLCARKEEVKVLDRYISIWEPINFMSRKEAERYIAGLLEDMIPVVVEKNLDRIFKKRKL